MQVIFIDFHPIIVVVIGAWPLSCGYCHMNMVECHHRERTVTICHLPVLESLSVYVTFYFLSFHSRF